MTREPALRLSVDIKKMCAPKSNTIAAQCSYNIIRRDFIAVRKTDYNVRRVYIFYPTTFFTTVRLEILLHPRVTITRT